MNYTIDATEKKIGRVASEAASILTGKNSPTFEKNKVSGNKVTIINASKVSIDPRKLLSVEFERYSGYPGGFKSETLAKTIEKKGYGEVFVHAVYNMIPANKLRSIIMKNLTVTE